MLRKILVITFLFGAVVATYAQKKEKKKRNKNKTEQAAIDTANIDYKAIGAPMPEIKAVTLKKETVTAKDFKSGGNLFIMVFNPTCDHCQSETTLLEKHIDKFKKTDLLLMAAPSMIDYLEFYNNVTRYSKYPKMVVGVDSANYIGKTFMYESLPQINVYDKDRKLIKVFSGETPIEKLEPYID